jgi:transcriptional regulator with XRE-family HTH domain
MSVIQNPEQARTGAYLARFRQRYGLTISKMCALFGISTQSKYNNLVRPNAEGECTTDLDPTIGLLLRLYETHEFTIPLNQEFSLEDAYRMFRRVFGADVVNESVFGQLLGRSPGSGYRWLSGSGNATPQVGIVLERLRFMLGSGMEEPEVCFIWLEVVQEEFRARQRTAPLAHIKPHLLLQQKYPIKYKNLVNF